MSADPAADATLTRCQHYRHVYGLPCYVHEETHRITLRAGDIGAVTVPELLGRMVHADLSEQYLLGPVIAHGSGRWTMLVRPYDTNQLAGDSDIFVALLRASATIVPNGGEILLPSPADERSGYRWWVVAPRDAFRPHISTVVQSIICANASSTPRHRFGFQGPDRPRDHS